MSANTDCVAEDDNVTTAQDSVLNGNVLADNGNGPDSDADGDTLTVTQVNGNPGDVGVQIALPSGALLTQNSDGTFSYNPNNVYDYLNATEFAFDTYTYTITDGNGSYDNATVLVNVTGLNDGPTAVDDGGPGFVTNEDSAFGTANVLTNDTDPDTNDALSVVGLDTTGTVGLVSDNGDGTFNYDPNGQFDTLAQGAIGFDFFNYTNSDESGAQDTAMVKITVTGVNDPPVLSGAAGTLLYDAGDPPTVIDSDLTVTDVDDINLEFAYIEITGNYLNTEDLLAFVNMGGITGAWNNGQGRLTLTGPDTVANFELALETVTYENSNVNPDTSDRTISWWVNDGTDDSNIVTSTVNLSNVNDAPVGVDDSGANYTTDEDTPFTTGNVTTNDTDLDNDTLVVSALDTTGTIGLVVDNGNGTFDYDPNGQFDYLDVGDVAYDFFNYTVEDPDGANDTAMVTITINGVNDPPVAVNDTGAGFITSETASITTANVLNNDWDPDNSDTVSYSGLDTTGTTGLVTSNGDGTFDYDPNGQFGYLSVGQQGFDFFNYTVTDGTASDTAMVTITITGENSAPTAFNDTATVVEDSGPNAINVLANDTDPDTADVLRVQSVTQGGNGTVVITGGGTGLTYEPVADFYGTDSFTYTVHDGHGGTDVATVSITVTNDHADEPVASDDTYTVDEDSGANPIDVLANDTDPDGDPLTVINITQGSHGTVAIINSGSTVSYSPDADYYGTDTFTYTITDGTYNTSATVTVTVANVNDDPQAVPDSAVMSEDGGPKYINVLANDDYAPDPMENLIVTGVTQGAHGSVTVTIGGLGVQYTPDANYNGLDTFTYTIEDGNGGTATATVTVTINSVNDDPVITGTDQTAAETGDAYSVAYTASDVDGDPLTWSLSTTASWLSWDATNGTLTGTAERGTFTVTLTVSDGKGGSTSRTFTLTVSELDSDDDGVPDTVDDFPNDPDESVDTDGDGVGNNADTDDDGDGTPDADDAFPLNPNESLDTDGDGIGNNADTDDDGDGVPDLLDPEPTNPAITGNEPSTGWPYWWVFILWGLIVLIGLVCVVVFGFVVKRT